MYQIDLEDKIKLMETKMLTQNVTLKNKIVLVTGAAGFVGANLVKALIKSDDNVRVVGLDVLNDYYDVSIKEYRLSEIDALVENKDNGKNYSTKQKQRRQQSSGSPTCAGDD